MRVTVLLLVAGLLTGCSQTPAPQTNQTVESVTKELTDKIRAKGSYRAKFPDGEGIVVITGDKTADIDLTTKAVVQTGKPAEQLRFVSTADNEVYAMLPPAFELPQDKPWVRLNRADTDDFTTTMLGFYNGAARQILLAGGHLQIIAATGALKSTVERDGNTTYNFAVDNNTITLDVDAQRLPTRLTVNGAATTFSDWGAAPKVTPPDPAQVSQRN
ncbi:hypothetical protein Lesp02_65600 [Lentzea sp. NBRC 105346]|uniref:hypothetical protein n=1 Tax=Lentzea sp. NBRC 105346 TaxID=3032205 RepID=UPI0024A33FC7|nr:hypothetical protein [Lentzea sp. NBRC 105346]GLZ34373.1 hypothetical protein Lesp02_65600 [Lentzea sp. NBRC 105346]